VLQRPENEADDDAPRVDDWFWSPSVRRAGRGTDRSRRTRGHLRRLEPATRGSFDLRCVLTETKTSRLVFAESRWLLVGSADPLRVERRIENVRVAGHDTCLARAFPGSQLRLTRKENPRRANPQSRAPAVQSTRVADATGNVGHIPTGANVAGILDHQMRRTTTLRESTTGFDCLQSGTLVEGPTGRGGPAATCSASNPRPADLSTCAAY
jgi:hypothetical protein